VITGQTTQPDDPEGVEAPLRIPLVMLCLPPCAAVPLFHVHGLFNNLVSSLCAGATTICTTGFDAQQGAKWLEGPLRPTWYGAVPTMHQLLVLNAEQLALHGRAPAMKTALRLIRSESSALPLPVAEKMEEYFGCVVVQTLAMSECSETAGPVNAHAHSP
jgi:acyl-CoA synthetase (AMP-forming)/AMP-acid ligase II